jgi:aryl-alcohol dehydrogenase-like predicted oxidoreductase
MDDMVNGISKCSKITLGTVQFGVDYGIANRSGKVKRSEALAMASRALERGVNSFDTAPGYGESEKVLGGIFRELGIRSEDLFLSDKIPPVPEGFSAGEIYAFIRGSVIGSFGNLGVDFIDVCLLHREKDALYMEELLKLKDEGIIGETGVSAYMPETAIGVIEEGLAGVVQIPANVFDNRFFERGVFNMAGEKEVSVFVRSVYLQGLLLMKENEAPEFLSEVRPALRILSSLAAEAGMAVDEFALRYAISLPGVSSVLVGADNLKQLNKNLNYAEKGPLEPDLFEKTVEAVPKLPERLVTPVFWEGK